MNVSDAQADSQWDKPRNEKRRNFPACYGDVGKNTYGNNCERDDTHERLIENALKQHKREITVHGRPENGHGSRLGDETPQNAREGRNHEFDDACPHHRSRADFPCVNFVMRLQVHGQHDRKRVSDDGGDVVAVDVRCDVGARLAPSQSDRKCRQSQ